MKRPRKTADTCEGCGERRPARFRILVNAFWCEQCYNPPQSQTNLDAFDFAWPVASSINNPREPDAEDGDE